MEVVFESDITSAFAQRDKLKHVVLLCSPDTLCGRVARRFRLRSIVERCVSSIDFKCRLDEHLTVPGIRHKIFDVMTLIGFGSPHRLSELDYEHIGGMVVSHTRSYSETIVLLADFCNTPHHVASLASGCVLGNYRFKGIINEKQSKVAGKLSKIVICTPWAEQSERIWQSRRKSVCDGTIMARELINLPANVLNPSDFADRVKELSSLGVEVSVYDGKSLKEQKLLAMYNVGVGSNNDSKMAVMRWSGASDKNEKPIVLLGKGVTFDSGGLSLKPAASMGDMKGDMSGAAAVVGLLHSLAQRKAKLSVIGVVGLVENMPSGNAQRPGDIVRTHSGKTVEILNTDAEGRLVLADLISYARSNLNPRFIVELSTLTGAIMVALGKEYAGLFTRDEVLAQQLSVAGDFVGEKLWRMPLDKQYDKLLDSKNADMKNIGNKYGGAIIAAQFLFRFAGDTSFAHIDIAGTALNSPKTPINKGWSSGFGVRLLEQFLYHNYEK